MKDHRLNRRHLIGLGAASGLLSACGTLPIDVGRSDRIPVEGGIGGTGIVGLVTDFSSLIVNGLKIETTRRTRYTDASGRINARSIGFGDVLTVEAETRENTLFAKRVHVSHPLIGRIQAIAGDGMLMMVNGVIVKIEEQAQGRAKPGDRVRVSGLWMRHMVVASQIHHTNDPTDVMAGEVIMRDGQMTMCEVPIVTGRFASGLKDGQYATVRGQFDGSSFKASDVTPDRFIGAAGALKSLSVEGYLDIAESDPGYKVSGLGHSFADNLALEEFAVDRAIFEGRYNGKFEAERGLILPMTYRERRTLFGKRAMGEIDMTWAELG